MTRWLSTDEVLARLGISRATLRAAMADTPTGTVEPWTCYGGAGASVRYRWADCDVDLWWREVCVWRRSKSVVMVGGSDGATLTARPAVVSVPRLGAQENSNSTSRRRARVDGGGSLPRLSDLRSSRT